ncbi:hypothetical protein DV515_00008754, partial [Chloebia gouldiae]
MLNLFLELIAVGFPQDPSALWSLESSSEEQWKCLKVSLQDPLEFTVGICTSGCPWIQVP